MQTRHRSAKSCCLGIFGALASCAGPGLRLDSNEPDAALYLDGHYVGGGVAEVPFRYYGTASITAVPVRRSPRDDVRAPVRTLVRVEPPAPEWLFPFDFFIEVARSGLASAVPVDAAVELPPSASTLAIGTQPPRADELRARAEQAQRER